MKGYFAYIRVSDPRQGKGVSLDEQKSAIAAYAKQRGIAIIEWFTELETASAKGRRVFSGMLGKLERGAADGLIIHKIDRSARNLEDWSNLGRLFDRGIDVQFAHDRVDLRTRGGRLSADIIAVVAADYIRNLRDEVKKGFYGRLKQGVYPLPAPMGYTDQGAGKPKEIDPVIGPIVKRAFELYATGTVGMRELKRFLETEGVRSRRGKQISKSTLAGMLRNPFYFGRIYIQKTNETFQGGHEPLITRQLFDRVQHILNGRFTASKRRRDFKYRRYLRCACGRLLTGELQKGRYVYYRCHSDECLGVCVNEAKVDAAVKDLLPRITLDETNLKLFKDLVDDEAEHRGRNDATGAAGVVLELEKLNASMDRLTDALIDGNIDKQTFEEKKVRIMNERLRLSERADGYSRTLPAKEVSKKFELQNIALLGYETATQLVQREILDSVSSNCVLVEKKLEFTLKSPYPLLQKLTDPAYGGPYRDSFRTFEELVVEVWRLAQAGWPANDNKPADQQAA